VLRNLRRALKPDGRLVLIEFRKESSWVPIREEHKMSVKEARMELEAEGYRFDRVIDVLPWQHILVFSSCPIPDTRRAHPTFDLANLFYVNALRGRTPGTFVARRDLGGICVDREINTGRGIERC